MNRPNIILLFADQQRWDSLACNGNVFTSTPHVDAIAASGANCINSFTPWPVCTPARATMWTGVYPHQHRIQYNTYGTDNLLKETAREQRTVFESVREAGYQTAYFGKWHLGDENPGMFDVWEGFNSLGGHWVDDRRDGVYKPDQQTDHLIEFLDQHAGNQTPFLAVNAFYPPHDPYTAPKRFYEPYRGKGVPFAGYYAAVSAIDDNVGRVSAALERLGIAEDTVLVYYSDHGDMFGYRGADHKFTCHDDSIHVPLMIRWPGRIDAGREIHEFVGLQDLMPTILEWAEIAAPEYLHGTSIVPLLSGTNVPWREAYYVENITNRPEMEQRCIRTRDWKLILTRQMHMLNRYSGAHELYDLTNDPEEELNLYLTPRKDNHNRYRHVPPHDDVVRDLAGLLAREAEAIDDPLGVELARMCLLEMSKRETRT